jgi:DNA polymerase-3 subunit epsilon
VTREFAVTDVETTGLFPKGNDRIVEIAILRVDSRGKTLDEYCTLINPKRDVGPTHIHGLSAKHVKHAPLLKEVLGDITSRLAGATFVAHNVHFDLRFLRSEMDREGYWLPEFPSLCTMQLARKTDPAIPGRKLETLCRHFGIDYNGGHSARVDARATADLLAVCLKQLKQDGRLPEASLLIRGNAVRRSEWPPATPSGKCCLRDTADSDIWSEPTYIARLVAKLPDKTTESPELDEYLLLLDRVLEDRRVTPEETVELLSLSRNLGLSREHLRSAHRSYMSELIRAAWADGIVTETEQEDLEEVRALLDIPHADYLSIFEQVEAQETERGMSSVALSADTTQFKGKTVCFTGAFRSCIEGQRISRSLARKIATDNGMVVTDRCTKTLDFLVTADPDSMSGKATQARKHGVRIIAEPVFWRMLGVNIE